MTGHYKRNTGRYCLRPFFGFVCGGRARACTLGLPGHFPTPPFVVRVGGTLFPSSLLDDTGSPLSFGADCEPLLVDVFIRR